MNLNHLEKVLFEADDETILLSRKNCHAKNVSSLVFKNENGRLSRCFLAWNGHELSENVIGKKMPVGIHNHYYDLTITYICGIVYNINYTSENITKKNKDRQEVLNHIKYKSGLKNGKPTVETVGKRFLKLDECKNIKGVKLHLPASKLHTMQAFGAAAWIVEEGDIRFDHVNLFSPYTASQIEHFCDEFDGLYGKFDNKEQVVDHFIAFRKHYENK